jgi:hypothetical protein
VQARGQLWPQLEQRGQRRLEGRQVQCAALANAPIGETRRATTASSPPVAR